MKLDAQSLGARVSKLEERLATGNFTPAKQTAKAENAQDDNEDDDRPPFPDDADDPLAGLAPPMDAREAERPQEKPASNGAQEELDRRWPELAASLREGLGGANAVSSRREGLCGQG